jgi:hypothetical protein
MFTFEETKRPSFWKKNQNKFAVLSALSLIIATVLFKTTFAANISLNSGSNVEYGQGIAQAVACSGATSITIAPTNAFTNSSNGGSFALSGFTVSNIPSGCSGFDFTITVYDNSSNTPLSIYGGTSNSVLVWDNLSNYVIPTSQTGLTITNNSTSSFTISFATPVASAGSTYKFGIQSSPNSVSLTCANGGSCNIGDTGPGGGVVFLINTSGYSETGAPCGSNCHYLEVAPTGWNGSNDPGPDWCGGTNNTTLINASGAGIGSGFSNTNLMMTSNGGCSEGAGYIAYNYAGNDLSAHQWFLASKGELNELCKYANTETTGTGSTCTAGTLRSGFLTNYYWWSSTEYSATDVYHQLFQSGVQGTGNLKAGSTLYMRPIRAF